MALLHTSIPDVSLSDLADPQRLALVSAFRDEVGRQVRPAQFSDLQGLVQGLSTGIQSELDKLGKRDKREAGPVAVGRVLRLAPRPVFLAGREELLAELEARLTGDDGAGPRVVALTGLGGAGKTSLALEYAHRQLDEVAVCWQFPRRGSGGAGGRVRRAGRPARRHRSRGSGGRGARGAGRQPGALAAGLRQCAGPGVGGPFLPGRARQVLITSRNQIWPPGQALEVPVLDPQVAAEFLVGRTGDADRRAALELADELGGLPLALEQAAAYMQASGDSLAGYLALFRQRRPSCWPAASRPGTDETVATTWGWPSRTCSRQSRARRATAAAGVLRARGGPAAPAAAAPPRAARAARRQVAPCWRPARRSAGGR